MNYLFELTPEMLLEILDSTRAIPNANESEVFTTRPIMNMFSSYIQTVVQNSDILDILNSTF